MMHIVKLCVGVASVEELESYREERAHWWGADYGEDVHVHRTRTMPKQAAEIEGQGSVYWVISGSVQCRQKILRLASARNKDGVPCCDIIMHPEIVRTLPRPKRPFQGWRYLKPADAPPDLPKSAQGLGELPQEMIKELSDLGLI